MLHSNSYVIAILSVLKTKGPLAIEALANEIFEKKLRMFADAKEPKEIEPKILVGLNDMVEIDVIRLNGENEYVHNFGPPIPPDNRRSPAGDDGDDGGGGLGEVLSHPILFAYSDDAFDDALERALTRFDNE